jgi:intracellular sulfur oxidation DsrE/DsrF family protein
MRHASYEVINTATIDDSSTTIGVAESNLYSMSNADIDKTLDKMLSIGVTNVRIGVFWRSVQPLNSTSYDWAKTDYIVKAAADRGMGILGVLNQTPAWAGNIANGHPDPDAYAKFAAAVAQRYAGKISAYEIWNEPNAIFEWNPVDAASYTEMLKKAYTAIKAVAATTNQDIKVIGGVVGAGLTIGNLSLDPVSFITQMYANGAKGYFDALSFHPYNYTLMFSQGPANTWPGTSALAQLQAIRALMNVKGDSDLKIWISEYGQPTMTGTPEDQAKQAQYLEDMITAWQKFLNGGPIFIYNAKDTGPQDSTTKEDHLGLFDYNWNAKAAADVIRKLILQLTGATPPTTTPGTPAAGLGGLVQQLVTAVASVVSNIVNFVPMALTTVVNVVKNLLGGIFGVKTTSSAASAKLAAAATGLVTAAVTADSVTAKDTTAADAAPEAIKHDEAATETASESTTEAKVSDVTAKDETATVPAAETTAGTEGTVTEPAVTEPATDPTAATVSDPKADPKADTKTDTVPATASDTKVDTAPASTTDPKTDTASGTTSDPKTDTTPKTDTKADSKADPKPASDNTTGDKVTRPGAKSGTSPSGVKPVKPKAGIKGKRDTKPKAPETTSGTPAATSDSRSSATAGASTGTATSE